VVQCGEELRKQNGFRGKVSIGTLLYYCGKGNMTWSFIHNMLVLGLGKQDNTTTYSII
jgi:hypothetical protein